jgi:hypothetical protein
MNLPQCPLGPHGPYGAGTTSPSWPTASRNTCGSTADAFGESELPNIKPPLSDG